MNTFWKSEWKSLALITAVFIICFYLPVEYLRDSRRLIDSFWEALYLVRWYAQEHVLLCLIPAFIIAGANSVFISQAAVMKYLGVNANKLLAYSVASVSGTILAVCSCTVLPLFAGIYKRGAGLGPAIAFLYSGSAINVLAIVLTAKVLGPELGIARAIGAVLFSVVIGLLMSLIFRKEEQAKAVAAAQFILHGQYQNVCLCTAGGHNGHDHRYDLWLNDGEFEMKKLQILGTDCKKCVLLTAHAEAAANELGIDYEIEK